MELIFLHGPPAVGKLTVARELMKLIPARLTDNHATIDLGRTVFDFGAPGFWDLVYKLRLNVLDAAARSDLPYLITTACYSHPADLSVVETWEDVLHRHDARLLPINLKCSAEVLMQRVVHPERAISGKIHSVKGLSDYLARNDFIALPRPGCITIDTEKHSPEGAAKEIMKAVALTAS